MADPAAGDGLHDGGSAVVTPILLVEDVDVYQAQSERIADALGRDVEVLPSFGDLVRRLDQLASDSGADAPVVILDPGVPGVCRLDAVRRTRAAHPRARIVVWTYNDEPSFHCASLLDGAMASLWKRRSIDTVATVVERAKRDRTWCEPDQAQWFIDMVSLAALCYRDGRSTVWQHTELKGAGFDADQDDLLARLREVAEGEPVGDDDRWFTHHLDVCRKVWLAPYLRQALMALALHRTRREAAQAIGKTTNSLNGYCGRLSGRLQPGHHIVSSEGEKGGGPVLMRWLITNHGGCELADADHDLSMEAFS